MPAGREISGRCNGLFRRPPGGLLWCHMARGQRRIDIVGHRFGTLTVLESAGVHVCPSGHRVSMWKCVCDCGTVCVMYGNYIRNKPHPSCGCRKIAKATTHGRSKDDVYSIWRGMIKRCHLPGSTSYRLYGAAGVSVCERWRESFEAFIADVGERPSSSHSIDRYPNCTGNYEPGNVRWATAKEQNNNKTDNRLIEFNGETMTMSQWAERIGISAKTLHMRLKTRSVEWSLTTPKYSCGPQKRQ